MSVALVTGAGGQDGRLLSRLLLSHGKRVIGAVRRADIPLEPGVERLVVDIGDRTAFAAALAAAAPASVFHLAAAHHSSEGGGRNPAEEMRAMIRVNFDAAATVIDWMADRAPSARAVFAGSSQMFAAPATGELSIDEASPSSPRTFYGRTKAWTRDLSAHARTALGLHAGFAVLFNHESELRGPGFVTRRIVDAAAEAACGRPSKLVLRNTGARADWSAARDIVVALAAMAESPEPDEFVLGSGTARRVADWVDIAFSRAGVDPAGAVESQDDANGGTLVADTARARARLGWQPSTVFRDLVEAMTDAALRESRSRGTAR